MKSKDINFEYIEEFVDYIVEKVEDDDELFVDIIGKFDEIRAILREVMLYENVNFESIHIDSPESNDYTDEYILGCWCGDGIVQIGCEPLKRDGKYIKFCGDITYLFSNCSSKIIPLCKNSELYFVEIGDENEFDYDEECNGICSCNYHKSKCVERSTDDKGNTHGFTASRNDYDGYYSFSYYSSDALSEEDINSMLKEFGF